MVSFVLVVHREQAYVAECAASVLDRGSGDVQLIAIDDASPDHGPAILDELAQRDPRVRVEHLDERVGLGAARNLALELVEDDYVWFVNATDLLAPDAVPAVVERLREASPDVLLVHHSSSGALGPSRPGPHAAMLERLEELGPGALDERPAAADAAPRAFDKVLRTELLRELGARFGPAGHDELTVTWPALLAAERIAGLAEPGYVRREPPNAVRDRYVGGSPLDVFAQHDAVLEFVRAHGELPGARVALLEPALLRHQLALLRRVPDEQRREFFERMSERYRAQPRGARPRARGRLGQLRSLLLEHDSYLAFAALEESLDRGRALARRRAAVARRGRRAARRLKRAGLERSYRARLRLPIDPDLAVFAAYWYRGYACNPRAVYEKARELVPGLRAVWIVKPEAVGTVPDGVEHVVAGTHEYYDAIARARYFVNNVNFPNELVKRAGTVHVMTHHGTPLKRMGLDERQSPLSRTNFAALLRRCARWDYSVSANPYSTLIWERAYPLPYESLEVGYPRNDVLATAAADDVRRARDALGIRPDQVAVLHAPTYRDDERTPVPVVDLEAVAAALGPDYVLLARQHYFYDRARRARRPDGRVRDVSGHPSVEQLCLAADVLLTDYSSIMFDYGVLDRPIVIHAPDWERYRVIRGTYFDLIAEPPGVVTRTDAEIVEALRSGAAWDERAQEARAAFRARFCALDDGHAAERVVRRVWLGERDVAAPAPAQPVGHAQAQRRR